MAIGRGENAVIKGNSTSLLPWSNFSGFVIPTGRHMIIVLMGVTGSGKSTVGRLLAERLQWKFLEGDDFHPRANIEKMKRGVPLNDEDRRPWLKAIRESIRIAMGRGENAVIACSALKASYRRTLQVGGKVIFIYLKADLLLIQKRLKKRSGHFMNPALIESQFDALEQPRRALQVDAGLSPATIVQRIRNQLHV
jgi:gluconokinase